MEGLTEPTVNDRSIAERIIKLESQEDVQTQKEWSNYYKPAVSVEDIAARIIHGKNI